MQFLPLSVLFCVIFTKYSFDWVNFCSFENYQQNEILQSVFLSLLNLTYVIIAIRSLILC